MNTQKLRTKRRQYSSTQLNHPNLIILGLTLGLIVFGIIMVFDASVVEAYHELGNQWYFIKNQTQSALIGFFLMLIAFFFPIKKLESISPMIIVTAILLLLLVLVPSIGVKVQGARRWLDLGVVRFQPSEFAKLATVIYLSSWLAKPRPARSYAFFLASIIGLIMMEPDMGTAMVIALTSAVMYFVSGVPIIKIIKLATVGILGIILLIAISPYRLDRLKTYLDPNRDPLGSSYHARQILISLGSGGMFGTGLGRSRQKFQYLPEASTDSIFAVVGEEFGFVGGFLLINAFAIIIFNGLSYGKHLKDPFIANIAVGVSVWLAIQVIMNLMAMVSLIPLTGIPMPLISYGGSALTTTMIGIGLLLNSTRHATLHK